MASKLKQLLHTILFEGKIFLPRKIIQSFCYIWLPLITLLITGMAAMLRHEHPAFKMGSISMLLFLVILFVSPLTRIIPELKIFRTLNSLRRELGVLCLWLSLWHGFGIVVARRQLDLDVLISKMTWDDLYFWGVLTTVGMIVLGVTSNNWSVKLFRKAWKKIHYLVYPTFLFAILHMVLIDWEDGIGYVILGIVYIALKVLVWKKVRYTLPENIIKNLQ